MSVANNLHNTLKNPSCASDLFDGGSSYYYYRSGCYGDDYVLISADFCDKCGQYKKAPYIAITVRCVCWLKLNAYAKQYMFNLAPTLHLLRNTHFSPN